MFVRWCAGETDKNETPQIRVLDLSYNHLTVLVPPVPDTNLWPLLERIDLSHNAFRIVPAVLTPLALRPHFERANMSDNQLQPQRLPPELFRRPLLRNGVTQMAYRWDKRLNYLKYDVWMMAHMAIELGGNPALEASLPLEGGASAVLEWAFQAERDAQTSADTASDARPSRVCTRRHVE